MMFRVTLCPRLAAMTPEMFIMMFVEFVGFRQAFPWAPMSLWAHCNIQEIHRELRQTPQRAYGNSRPRWSVMARPMMSASNIHYELSDKTLATR